MSFDARDQILTNLQVKQLSLLLHEWLHSLFDLLFDDLWQGCLDCLCNSLLNLDLEVFLGLDLLLQAVHLHVQLCKFLVQLLVVFNDLVLLLLFRWRHSH